jgi:hypothetical protein
VYWLGLSCGLPEGMPPQCCEWCGEQPHVVGSIYCSAECAAEEAAWLVDMEAARLDADDGE